MDYLSFRTDLGARLRALRTRAGLSQGVLAERIGCTKGHISGVEIGRNNIAMPLLFDWVEACGGSLSVFLEPADHATVGPMIARMDREDRQVVEAFARSAAAIPTTTKLALRGMFEIFSAEPGELPTQASEESRT